MSKKLQDPKGEPQSGELKITYERINSLFADPSNPRKITEEELGKLERSISVNGFVEPIIVRKSDRVIVAGHQRARVAARLGFKKVPVVMIEIGIESSKLLNVALNKISGEFDLDLLEKLFADIEAHAPGFDSTISGFDQTEIGEFLNSIGLKEKRERIEEFDIQGALNKPKSVSTTRIGDMFALGPHVVMCGDARSQQHLSSLLAEASANMLFADPPYNANFNPKSNKIRGNDDAIINDNLDEQDWKAFVDQWVNNCTSCVDGAMYICPGIKELNTLSSSLKSVDAHWSDTLIWVKDRFVLGRADYHRAYEPIWYGWPKGVKRCWLGGRTQSDVWKIDRPNESPLHPTQKPPELIERAIENSTRIGDTVLDPFLGSGSSLIAAERTGRHLRGLEIAPDYVDVSIARWESFTGQKAVKL